MSKPLRPEEPETIDCEICMKEIPSDEAKSAEGEDYVIHFCGLECYSKWREQASKKDQSETSED